MISHIRPLFYSLFIHICLLGLFIFAFTYTPKKESRTSLKLQMICSCSDPATLSKKQASAQPAKEIKSIPVQKTTPITPTPLIQKAPTPLPTAQPTPAVAPQPISRPSISIPTAAPPSPTVETSKAVHQPIVPSVNVEKEFLDAHLGEIRALLIQNLRYPKNAQRLKMQGEVRVGFRLKSDGSVDSIEVIQSSGFELLDEDAKTLIKNTAPQFPKPTKNINLSIPLSYLLR